MADDQLFVMVPDLLPDPLERRGGGIYRGRFQVPNPRPFLFLQAFGLGVVVATFGLALDLIGFVLLLLFVAATSVVGLRRCPKVASASFHDG